MGIGFYFENGWEILKGSVGLYFIKVILMAVGVGWVLRVRKLIKEIIGINSVGNCVRIKVMGVGIGKEEYIEVF